MGIFHSVKEGEHFSGIALKYGFPDYRVLWNRPENSELKKKRKNPNVLFPGDQVFIPDKTVKQVSGGTDQRHTFELKTKPLFLKLELLREYDDPLSNTECELTVEADTFKLTSDGKGTVQKQISPKAHAATLRIKDKIEARHRQIPFDRLIAIRIGDLDPEDTKSGQVARLANLGYYRGGFDPVDDKEFESAVEEFQCEHPPLKVDGICGPQTQNELRKVHGC